MNRFLVIFVILFFVACTSQSGSKSKSTSLEKGKEIASASFTALNSKLMSAIGAGGPEKAVEFCSLEALAITDSLSKSYGATLKRSALKYRNIKNKPDSSELAALVKYSEEIAQRIQPQPYVINVNGEERFIAPIPTKALCLNCHGTPGINISEPVEAKINELYPDDMAIGFQEGDLRGIWSITFEE